MDYVPKCINGTFDNYVFIRKHFHPFWSLYILLIRLISFKNPINEISSYLKSKRIKREFIRSSSISNIPEVNHKNPLVTVVIPTLNRYRYLKDVLIDLEVQTYKRFEVIVIDQSNPFEQDFYQQFHLNLDVIHQKDPKLWKARNRAIKDSNGSHILLFDDDSRVSKNWIQSHLDCLVYYNADISSGISISAVGDKVPTNYDFFRLSDQLDTGNTMLKRYVFEEIGLFDEQFEKQRMGDAEFGLRAYLAGYKNISNPLAKRVHLKVSEGGLRQHGHWDAFRSKQWYSPKPVPSVLYYSRRYFGDVNAKYWLLKNIPPSIIPYKLKHITYLRYLAYMFLVFFVPFVIPRVIKSWNISSSMIEKGPQIPKFEKNTPRSV